MSNLLAEMESDVKTPMIGDNSLKEMSDLCAEQVALEDAYFVDRKLYPNVDFYSGVIYRAIGVPVEMFTVLFSMGRLPGWIAHWQEMHASPSKRICRPRQVYTGPTARDIAAGNEAD